MRPQMTDSNGHTPIAPTLFQQAGTPANRQLGNWTEPQRDVGRVTTQVCLATFPRAKRLTILALTQQVKKLRK